MMIKVPGLVLRIAGLFGDLLRKLNIKTDLCTPNMESLCIENYYTNYKSATELNVQYHSIETAIKLRIISIRTSGNIKTPKSLLNVSGFAIN